MTSGEPCVPIVNHIIGQSLARAVYPDRIEFQGDEILRRVTRRKYGG